MKGKIDEFRLSNLNRSSFTFVCLIVISNFIVNTACVLQKSGKIHTLRPNTLSNFDAVENEPVGQARANLIDGTNYLELDESDNSTEPEDKVNLQSDSSDGNIIGDYIESQPDKPMPTQFDSSGAENGDQAPPNKMISNMDWDYKNKGADWNFGACSAGLQQSPIDLNVEGLEIAKHADLVQTYVDAMKNPQSKSKRYKNVKTWKPNDFFYHFSDFHGTLNLYKDYKSMEVEPFENLPFGLLIPTDTHHIFYASKITFHTPSEHTFQGSGNRRELEIQIWHYSRQHILNLKDEKNPEEFLSSYIEDILENEYNDNRESLENDASEGSWRVISLTFMSGELSSSTKKDVEDLPSEKFIASILGTHDTISNDDQVFQGQVNLSHPMNLPSLFLMLQLGSLKFYTYSGSDTIPPCNENVVWYVAAEPFPLSTETMLKLYKFVNSNNSINAMSEDGNYRELQPVETSQRKSSDIKVVSGYPIQLLIQETLANS